MDVGLQLIFSSYGWEAACFRYGGMPQDEALASMRLFAERVLPELKSW